MAAEQQEQQPFEILRGKTSSRPETPGPFSSGLGSGEIHTSSRDSDLRVEELEESTEEEMEEERYNKCLERTHAWNPELDIHDLG